MGTAAGMVAAMRGLLGMAEQPAGSNHNSLTAWYAGRHGHEYDPCPWCDIAVAYAAAVSANTDATMGEHAWTVEHANAFAAADRWHAGTAGIRPGDLVFFDWAGTSRISAIDHVGVVEAIHSDGTLTTIEGNTDNRCQRRRRSPRVVAGYGRPAYDSAPEQLAVDGVMGPQTIAALQRLLNAHQAGLVVDGVMGPQTRRALQRHLGVTADGIIGPATTSALQARIGAAVDGVWGADTTRRLQMALNAAGF